MNEASVEMPHRERTPAEERALGLRATPPVEVAEEVHDQVEPAEVEEQVEDEATPGQQADEDLDVIEPKAAHRTWTFTNEDGEDFEYIQKPLSYFGKMEFFSVLGNAVDLALANEGMSMSSLLGGGRGGFNPNDLLDADSFVRTVSRLVVFAPDLLQDSFCIWLNVPRGERAAVKMMMRDSLTDDDAQEIIEVFIDQNMEAMTRFFIERIPKLSKRAKSRMPTGVSLPSKRSKPSRPSIQSR